MFAGALAIGGERLKIGLHDLPGAAGLRGLGDCAWSCLALLESSAQAFDSYRSVDQFGVSEQVGKGLRDRICFP